MYVRVRPLNSEEQAAKSRTIVSVTPGRPDQVFILNLGLKIVN